MLRKTERKNAFKGEKGWDLLRSIVRQYENEIQGHFDYEDNTYPAPAKMEFPLQLLKDVHSKGEFVNGKENYPILEQYGLSENFYLSELLDYIGDKWGNSVGQQWFVDGSSGIEKITIKDNRVYLDVLVKEIIEEKLKGMGF